MFKVPGELSGDQVIKLSTAFVVVAVATFAAIVSYSHIFDLGHTHGQDGTAARLLPLSVDGLILAASLVILYEARKGHGTPALARVMLWLGVAATLAANAAYGAGFGLVGVTVSLWPAVAFIGSVELIMGLVRRARIGVEESTGETEDIWDGPCIDGAEHSLYNTKAGTKVSKCRRCRRSVRLSSLPALNGKASQVAGTVTALDGAGV